MTDNKTLWGGTAKVDLTNPEPGIKVTDRLYAKVLVLTDRKKNTAVIISMDQTAIGGRDISCGILPDSASNFPDKLRSLIKKELNILPSDILINASHTHPSGRMLCNDSEQISRTFSAVKNAFENLFEIKAGFGTIKENTLTMNRNLNLKNGKNCAVRHSNPGPQNHEIAGVNPIDDVITVLRVDKIDNSPLAVVYNFGCHPLWGDLNGGITANFPGIASKVIEDILGNGVMAIFLQGDAGDVVDCNFKNFAVPRDVSIMGNQLGIDVLRCFRSIKPRKISKLAVFNEPITLPRRQEVPQLVEKLKVRERELLDSLRFCTLNFDAFIKLYTQYKLDPQYPLQPAFRYLQERKIGKNSLKKMDEVNRNLLTRYLENIKIMEDLTQIQDDIGTLLKHHQMNVDSKSASIKSEVQLIRIGDGVIITSAAEILTQIGKNLRRMSGFKYTILSGYSNGYLHYGVPRELYCKGGYEVCECFMADDWQTVYEQKAADLFQKSRQ